MALEQDPSEHSSTISAGREGGEGWIGVKKYCASLIGNSTLLLFFLNNKAISLLPHCTLANHTPGNLKSSRKIFIPSTKPGYSFAVYL